MGLRVGIVCGLAMEREALGPAILADPTIRVAVSGARPNRAAEAATAMAKDGASLLVSLGLAGGLDPALATGAVLCPSTVTTGKGVILPLFPGRLGALAARDGRLLGLDRVVLDPAEKRRLGERHDAVAVDMETHAVARAGTAHGVAVAALRVIGDDASTALPSLAAEAVDAEGRPDVGRVLRGLARRPGALPALVRAGRDSRRALGVLAALAPSLHAALAGTQGGTPAE